MLTIGFAQQYYTLWNVEAEKVTNYADYGHGAIAVGSYTKVTNTFIRNLSKDLDKAKAKLEGQKFDIDLSLRGSSTFFITKDEKEEWGGELNWTIFPINDFRGKLRYVRGESIMKSENIGALFSAYETDVYIDRSPIVYATTLNARHKALARKRLVELGKLIKYNGEYMTPFQAQKLEDKLQSVHHFEDGDKVELEIILEHSSGFETAYGYTFIQRFRDREGRQFMYMGSTPKDFDYENYTKIKATIKHDEWNGVKQNKLLRIKKL